MDRGVKIALFVASLVSLALGLVWDQVLSQARVAVQKPQAGDLAPEELAARVGSPEIPRLELEQAIEEQQAAPQAAEPAPGPAVAAPQPAPAVAETEYEVQTGDSWWSIANRKFKDRGLSSTELEKANPGVTLRPGKKIRIPAGKKAAGK
ncbi:MAG: LysM peptidoglycan-binding domain-containing protein [Planctomycetes bacterium]|nr:LysM peptidoglycan-binding domain-containing protein [Planctomycetota bacterium]